MSATATGTSTLLHIPHPVDRFDAYIQGVRFFHASRLNLTLIDDHGSVLALSPLAVRQSRWPCPAIFESGVPEVTRHLYLDPAERAWTTNRIVNLPPTPYSTRHRDLLLTIRHLPIRAARIGRYVTLAITTHIAEPGLWKPPAIESIEDRRRFGDLVETQAVLWAEANAWLRNAARSRGGCTEKAARIASAAGRRLEAMVDAFLSVSTTVHSPG